MKRSSGGGSPARPFIRSLCCKVARTGAATLGLAAVMLTATGSYAFAGGSALTTAGAAIMKTPSGCSATMISYQYHSVILHIECREGSFNSFRVTTNYTLPMGLQPTS